MNDFASPLDWPSDNAHVPHAGETQRTDFVFWSLTNTNRGMELSLALRPLKPRRPLSAYCLFFQQERQMIHQNTPTSTEGERRIGFGELHRTISARWGGYSADDKAPFERMAIEDKKRFKTEMAVWRSLSVDPAQLHADYQSIQSGNSSYELSQNNLESDELDRLAMILDWECHELLQRLFYL